MLKTVFFLGKSIWQFRFCSVNWNVFRGRWVQQLWFGPDGPLGAPWALHKGPHGSSQGGGPIWVPMGHMAPLAHMGPSTRGPLAGPLGSSCWAEFRVSHFGSPLNSKFPSDA
jgi:hypothetical protein